MYRVLIVDDEKWIRMGVEVKLNAMFPGALEMGAASSASKALAALQADDYDVLITDIRMPGMDGIELVRHAHELQPGLQAIIISGHADFAYAEQALNMGVLGYILKPLQDEKLQQTVKKALDRVEQARQALRIVEDVQAVEADRSKMLAEKQLNLFLNADAGKTPPYVEELKAQFSPELYYVLMVANIDYTTYQGREEGAFVYQDAGLIRYGIRNIISECAERYGFAHVLCFDNLKNENQVLCLMADQDEQQLDEAAGRFLIRSFEAVQKNMKISATFALSGTSHGLSPVLYRQAREVVELRLLHGTDKFYRYGQMEAGRQVSYPADKMALLKKSLERQDFDNVAMLLKRIFDAGALRSVPEAKVIFYDVVNTLIRTCIKKGIPTDALVDSGVLDGDVFDSCCSMEDVTGLLLSVMEKVLRREDLVNIKRGDFNGKVLDYVEHNYVQPLTVKSLAAQFATSPNYFSNLFSKYNGVSFTQYLTALRIEKACALLRDTDMPVEHVAESVGFQDANYFYRVFKREKDQTPSDYRNSKAHR